MARRNKNLNSLGANAITKPYVDIDMGEAGTSNKFLTGRAH